MPRLVESFAAQPSPLFKVDAEKLTAGDNLVLNSFRGPMTRPAQIVNASTFPIALEIMGLGETACCGATHFLLTYVDDGHHEYGTQSVLVMLQKRAVWPPTITLITSLNRQPSSFEGNLRKHLEKFFTVEFTQVSQKSFLLILKPHKPSSIQEFQAYKGF